MQRKKAKVHDTRAKVVAEKAKTISIKKTGRNLTKRVNVSDTSTTTMNWAESVKQKNVVDVPSIVNMDEDSSSSSYTAVNNATGSREEHSGMSYAT
ncbi:11814_t:CDS:1, partial [Gigaspora rosea]